MRASSWSAWRSPTSTRSTASRRPSPSGRRTPPAIRARRSPRPPSATISCACSIARVGQTFCPNCGTRVRKDTVDEVAARLLELPEGSRWYALFPARRARPSTQALRDHLFELRKKGFNRLFQGGRLFEFSTPESLLDIDFSKPLFVLVDRIAIGARPAPAPGGYHRDLLSRSGRGDLRKRGRRPHAALQREVPVQDLPAWSSPMPEPILFSFNSPAGRLPALPGLRQHHRFRHGPRHPGQDAVARRGRGGPVDQAASTAPGWPISRSTPRAACASNVPYCDLTAERARHRRRLHPPLLRSSGEQEVQAARARLPEPLSRLRAVPGVPAARACASRRSTCGWAERTSARWCG